MGKFQVKQKIVSITRPKSYMHTDVPKMERDSTPQRWSRRIRSLPPIPFDVLKVPPRKRSNKKIGQIQKITKLKQLESRSMGNLMYDTSRTTIVDKNRRLPCRSKDMLVAKKHGIKSKSIQILPLVFYKQSKKPVIQKLLNNYEIELKKRSKSVSKSGNLQLSNNKHKDKRSIWEKQWSKLLKVFPNNGWQ